MAVVAEFQNGQWTALERIDLAPDRKVLEIDADRATCLILLCEPGTENRWADRLTHAMLHPDRIDGY